MVLTYFVNYQLFNIPANYDIHLPLELIHYLLGSKHINDLFLNFLYFIYLLFFIFD